GHDRGDAGELPLGDAGGDAAVTGTRDTGNGKRVIEEAANAVAGRLGKLKPRVAIVLGSGLGAVADAVQSAIRIPQSAIPRFPDMSDPYDSGLRATARAVARAEGIPLEEGVYAALLGPSFETPAEIRMLERLGADAVGMSTVPEVIAARARGMRCLGFSSVT